MGGGSDYGNEMDRLDPRQIDAALAGDETGEPTLDRAARLVAELRHTLLEEPGPKVAARHQAAMAAARSGDRGSSAVLSQPRPRSRGRLAGLALAATLLLGAGVAAAVTLPNVASDRAGEAVSSERGPAPGWPAGSEEIPTGPEEVPTGPEETGGPEGTHGGDVSDVAHGDTVGCKKGESVSQEASSKSKGQGPDERQDPCVRGDEGAGAGAAHAQEASAHGKQKAEEAKSRPKPEGGRPAGAGDQGRGKGKP